MVKDAQGKGLADGRRDRGAEWAISPRRETRMEIASQRLSALADEQCVRTGKSENIDDRRRDACSAMMRRNGAPPKESYSVELSSQTLRIRSQASGENVGQSAERKISYH